jgi:TRAP-type C4-dicarboxylate transport system permease small subunit
MVEKIERAWAWVLLAFAALNGLFIFVLAVMITTDVMARWLVGRPFVGVFEISRILFVPIIFMVLALVQWTDRQVCVDVLAGRARGRARVAVRTFDQVAALAFFSVLLFTGAESWLEAVRKNFVEMGMLEIPHAVPIGFLVVGTFLLVLTLVLLLVRSFRQLVRGVPSGRPLTPYMPPLRDD